MCMRQVTQSCLTLCDPVDYSLPGSSVHGISLARMLEWLLFPYLGDLSESKMEPRSPALANGFLPLSHQGS